ncbi:flagellar protein FliT [Anoxybacillus flavithermus]|uniref:flagellar protein FliT n=1 Tax=Anoxybacillus flavithermus TaxID=33934 RepID=UPI001867781D|nr:flagellar protein FliT [Anoxybacillus flavithermus]MBE2906177.1 flagellar protein FliT [Anoxybacillus flavithermus]
MSVVFTLLEATRQLANVLREPVSKEKRDEVIARIEQLLEERERLLAKLPSSLTAEERKMGQEILALNAEIDEKLQQLKQQIQFDLKQTKKTETVVKHYNHPYEPLSIDGMFYDKKR